MAMKKPRKQSGDKASALAGNFMRVLRKRKNTDHFIIAREDLATLCASVLSQDETKGKRGR